MIRVFAALLAVSLAAPLTILLLSNDPTRSGAFAVGAYTVPATFLLGLPTLVVFSRYGCLKWWHAALAGVAVSALCALPFLVGGIGMFASLAIAFLTYGVPLALLFRFLGIWRNTRLASCRGERPSVNRDGPAP